MAARKTKPRKWAPSARDQEIFLRVERDGRTQRQAAEEFGVSQPRIHKIVAKVEDWLQTYQTRNVSKFSPEERLNFVRWFYREVIDKLWRDTLATWDKAMEDQVTVQQRKTTTKSGTKTITATTTRPGRGNLACLRLATQCVEELARLDGFDEKAWLESERKKREEEAKHAAEEAQFLAWLAFLERATDPAKEALGNAKEMSPQPSAADSELSDYVPVTCDESGAALGGSSKSSQGSYQIVGGEQGVATHGLAIVAALQSARTYDGAFGFKAAFLSGTERATVRREKAYNDWQAGSAA